MLYLKRIHEEDIALLETINSLYEHSFPANERKDLKYLLMPNQDIGEIIALMDDDDFIGFMCLLNANHIAHIIYFSIKEADRDEGYGSKFIALLKEHKKHDVIIADLEVPTPTAPNNEQRIIRRKFYERNGFIPTEVTYRWHQDSYEILSLNGTINEKEWDAFWESIGKVSKQLFY